MSKELLPCPHCGKTETVTTWQDDIEVNPDGYWTVVCCFTIGGCGAMCGYRPTEEEAIAEWNTRAERICIVVDDDGVPRCSLCNCVLLDCWEDITKHCPNCGARVVSE